MTPSGASELGVDPVSVYENLRSAVLCGQASGLYDLGTIRRQGLATWLSELKINEHKAALPLKTVGQVARPVTQPIQTTPCGLTRLLAEIIVGLTVGDSHAHT